MTFLFGSIITGLLMSENYTKRQHITLTASERCSLRELLHGIRMLTIQNHSGSSNFVAAERPWYVTYIGDWPKLSSRIVFEIKHHEIDNHPRLTPPLREFPSNFTNVKLTVHKFEALGYLSAKTARSELQSFRHNTIASRRAADIRQTDDILWQ